MLAIAIDFLTCSACGRTWPSLPPSVGYHWDGADDATSMENCYSNPEHNVMYVNDGDVSYRCLARDHTIDLHQRLIYSSMSGKKDSSEIQTHLQIEAWGTWTHLCSNLCNHTLILSVK